VEGGVSISDSKVSSSCGVRGVKAESGMCTGAGRVGLTSILSLSCVSS
jgi:hypothetical protein